MAFVDNTTGGRLITATGPITKLTIKASSTVTWGDPLGYSAGWVRAASATIPAEYIALGNSSGGDEISVCKNCTIDFGTGSTATAGDNLFVSTTAGQYTATGPTVTGGQIIGEMVSAQVGRIELAGSLLTSESPSQGIGYATGAGGAVTQLTNRTTGVTVNTICGTITTVTTSLAAEVSASFIVTNSRVAIGDVVVACIQSGSNGGNTDVVVTIVTAGTFTLMVANNNAAAGTAETGALLINFAVVKAVSS